jgi:energy-coupling factor transporter ATP-binding protein EcfA2
MMPEQGQPAPFPRHLLQHPPERRLDYFKAYTVAHPALTQADQAVWNALREPAGAALIFVVGPTGVGKTTLLTHIERRLIDLALSQGDRSSSRISTLKLDAVSPALTQFKWGDYYQRALLLLQEPRLEYAVDYRRQVPALTRQTIEQNPLPWKGRTDTASLRLIFEQALKHRKPYAILIDEAEHIAKAARGSKLLDQLDHLKSLAIMSQVVHVLVGTYDLMVFRNLSAQLSRRSIDVHFSRYHATNEADVRAFKSVLWSFQRNLPLEEEPDLLQHWKYCYERTIGCVGVLKDWFTRALAEVLEQGEKTLSRPLLEQHALSVDRCGQMVTEAVAGETALTEDDHAAYRLRVRLGLEQGPAERHGQDLQGKGRQERNVASPRRLARVGQRKPTRDPVKKESGL